MPESIFDQFPHGDLTPLSSAQRPNHLSKLSMKSSTPMLSPFPLPMAMVHLVIYSSPFQVMSTLQLPMVLFLLPPNTQATNPIMLLVLLNIKSLKQMADSRQISSNFKVSQLCVRHSRSKFCMLSHHHHCRTVG